MKVKLASILIGILALVVAVAAGAQKKKEVAHIKAGLVFNEKVYLLEPNIDVALMTTEDQREPLLQAYEQTLGVPTLEELQQKAAGLKLNPNDPEAAAASERLKTEMLRAREDMRRRVDLILSDEQKATIRKVNQAVEQAIPNALTQDQRNALAAVPVKK